MRLAPGGAAVARSDVIRRGKRFDWKRFLVFGGGAIGGLRVVPADERDTHVHDSVNSFSGTKGAKKVDLRIHHHVKGGPWWQHQNVHLAECRRNQFLLAAVDGYRRCPPNLDK